MIINKQIGIYIKTHRQYLDLTRTEVAKKSGVNRTYISKIENQGWLPSYGVFNKILKQLKLNVGQYHFVRTEFLRIKHPDILEDIILI